MIDKLVIFTPNVKNKIGILNRLKPLKVSSNNRYYLGTLNNLMFRISSVSDSIFISGSLPKYLYGNNYTRITRKDIEKSIHNIEDELNICLENSFVFKLEIGSNIIVKNPVQDYINCIIKGNHLYRKYYKGTLYLQNKTRKIIFYDKYKELIDKKISIPDYLKNKNILRYELRINKRLARYFKYSRITPYTLFDETFYIKMIKEWHNQFKSLLKHDFKEENLNFMINNNKNSKNSTNTLFEYLSLTGIKNIGIDNLFKSIEELEIDIVEKSKLKSEIFKLLQKNDNSNESQLIKELNQKIGLNAKYFR